MNTFKQILITGISSDLGTVLANAFATDKGINIIGSMRRKLLPDDNFPDNVLIVDECDLTDIKDAKRIASVVSATFHEQFSLIHSVGNFWEHVPFLQTSSLEAQKMFESHMLTLYTVLQEIIPIMISNGGGSCVAFSCNSTKYNYPLMAAFTASKSSIESLIRSLAHEFSGDRIRFNSLSLASLKTKKVKESKPHGDFVNFLDPLELVPIIRFLLSDDSIYVNGTTFNIYKYSDNFYRKGYLSRIAK